MAGMPRKFAEDHHQSATHSKNGSRSRKSSHSGGGKDMTLFHNILLGSEDEDGFRSCEEGEKQ
jgi:hypothetical protein